MKVSREKAAEHRAAILAAAARLFRERGFDGVSIADIMQSAGLTHGGFYGHFPSKQALAAEACGKAFSDGLARMTTVAETDIMAYVESYLSVGHRDRTSKDCPMVALSGDVCRQDEAVKDCFSGGVDDFVEAVATLLPERSGESDKARRARGVLILSAMVGGVTLSRATAEGAPGLSEEILATLKQQVGTLVEGRLKA